MRLVIPARQTRLRAKTCLTCGYRGPELQGERGRCTFECPSCGEDLYSRPARSYAELEGLDDSDAVMGIDVDLLFPAVPRWRLTLGRVLRTIWRWMTHR